MEALLSDLQREFSNVEFEIKNGTIVAVIERCGSFGMLLEKDGKVQINRNAARAARRMTLFYRREYEMIRAGHAGKYAVVDDEGQISIYRTPNDAFTGRDLSKFYICQIGAGPVLFDEVEISTKCLNLTTFSDEAKRDEIAERLNRHRDDLMVLLFCHMASKEDCDEEFPPKFFFLGTYILCKVCLKKPEGRGWCKINFVVDTGSTKNYIRDGFKNDVCLQEDALGRFIKVIGFGSEFELYPASKSDNAHIALGVNILGAAFLSGYTLIVDKMSANVSLFKRQLCADGKEDSTLYFN